MTTSRRGRRSRNPVRRLFATGAGSATSVGPNMIDIAIVAELGASDDSQFGELLVTGMAWIDLVDETAIHQIVVWVGRTSTEPSASDTGVRTRQFGANLQALPFVLRFRGLRVDPGMQMRLISQVVAESDAAIIHQNLIQTKWAFREMRQG